MKEIIITIRISQEEGDDVSKANVNYQSPNVPFNLRMVVRALADGMVSLIKETAEITGHDDIELSDHVNIYLDDFYERIEELLGVDFQTETTTARGPLYMGNYSDAPESEGEDKSQLLKVEEFIINWIES